MTKSITKKVMDIFFCLLILYSIWILYNFKFYIVMTGSMQPTIEVGEFIVTKKSNKYEINDIITFKYDESNYTITHRLVEIDDDGNIHTQGDYNNTEDMRVIKKDNIIGKVIFHSLLLGRLVKNYRTIFLGICCLLICMLSIKGKEKKVLYEIEK